jgi:hypothetical protein
MANFLVDLIGRRNQRRDMLAQNPPESAAHAMQRHTLQQQFVARVAELETLLDRAGVEDFAIGNAGRSVTDVAREMLTRAGWL